MITIDKQQQHDVREDKKQSRRIRSWREMYAEMEREGSYQTRVVHVRRSIRK
jgi:hypothetical protein